MKRPLIQIDGEVREVTDAEYEQLIADGWTPEVPVEEIPIEEPATEEPAPDPE